ncbi:cytochrome c biogenesis protein [Synechocystis sp. FACHB-383]|uniref:cytochrome c biogenesis protein n=1 Tax=Synechocystis sp. FACHB-383 TaxID=2692864 RepID=UPI001689B68F|nr:cytochrome c biogenesis protein [Synechocystis sp. FACHB-383]MBD2653522.1 cytochrome c biogenesis protein [Synechocystis sp. FACHB-383]
MTLANSSPTNFLQQLGRQCLKTLADLRLAIALLLLIAVFSISGTVIEQGESLSFYQQNYPEDPALFGFLSWQVILQLGLNQVYRTWWFLGLLILFGSSLTACTFNRQFPALKAARSWQFYHQPRQFNKLALSFSLPHGDRNKIEDLLQNRGYKIFQEGDSIYARKGLMGKIGPIIVHAAMLIILGGAIWGALTGFFAQHMIPSGETFQVNNIIEKGPLADKQIPKDWGIKVNRFWIDYTEDGAIDQFYSDLSVVSSEGEELDRQTISVNHPLRHQGVTFYQTNWGIAGVKVQLNNSPVLQLPMAPLQTANGGQLWGAYIPTKTDFSEGAALLVKDLQGTMIIYDQAGNLTDAVRAGSTVEINGVNITIKELVGSTGLQIKADPGIPFVYLGFGLLMLGVMMSYVSHSQVWLLSVQRDGQGEIYLGGRTNRAQVAFEREILAIAEQGQGDLNSEIKVNA